jgi:RNA polymerase sigma-70 factor (ECF subfamily)
MDFLRKADRRLAVPLDAAAERAGEAEDPVLLRAALSSFLALPARQRSAVILKDVLGFSLEEIAEATGMSLLAVKSALVRGRSGLQEHAADLEPEPPPTPDARRERLDQLNRYVSLFNDGNWGALRAMLSDEVRLDMVSHRSLRGKEVGNYYTRYAEVPDVHLDVVMLEGREAILVTSTGPKAQPPYFMLLDFDGGKVASIRDFRYVPYIAQGAEVRPVDGAVQ